MCITVAGREVSFLTVQRVDTAYAALTEGMVPIKKERENAMSNPQELDASQLDQVRGAGCVASELARIEVQMFMQERQFAIQYATHMGTKVSDALNSIAKNIGK
jgi:hypothetical protein